MILRDVLILVNMGWQIEKLLINFLYDFLYDSEGFAIPASNRPQSFALDRSATGIGCLNSAVLKTQT
jgi:hypothetical protein